MEQINKSVLIYNDLNYTKAVNYRHLYNAPITLNYGPKHGRKKYILGAGNSDHLTLLKEGVFIYVVSENCGLNYMGLEVINTETHEIENSVFLNDSDLSDKENICYNLTALNIQEQIKVLFNYLD